MYESQYFEQPMIDINQAKQDKSEMLGFLKNYPNVYDEYQKHIGGQTKLSKPNSQMHVNC